MARRLLCAGLLAAVVAVPTSAQSGSPAQLLDRAARYVREFVHDFSNVVAEEEYRQEYRFGPARRRLKSDFLLVRYPGDEGMWLAFRDVFEVNGRAVRDQQDRLTKLFMEPFADAVRRAEEITRDGSRHSLVELGPETSPFALLALLQATYQPGYIFRLGGVDSKLGPNVRALELEERIFPDQVNPALRRVPLRGIAWVEEDTGRVVKTELRLGTAPNTRLATTTFRFDEGLGIDVPAEMRDSRVVRVGTRVGIGPAQVEQFIGVATYTRFRRFQVRTDETIQPEPTVQ